MRCSPNSVIVTLIICLSPFSCACAQSANSSSSSDCRQQRCGEVSVSYPFALADRADCPRFSPFFELTCDPSLQLLLHNLNVTTITPNGTTPFLARPLLVTSIAPDSLVVDITPFNASSLPPRSPPSCSSNLTYAGFRLPSFPAPFFISDQNEFGSFGCSYYGTLITSRVLPPSSTPLSSPQASPLPPPSPAEVPAPPPSDDGEFALPLDDYAGLEVGGCVVLCPGDEGNASLCGIGHDCCVISLPSHSTWRFAEYTLQRSPFAPSTSCTGETNYASLFHRSSSDLNRGLYRLKLMWALPSNLTHNPTELRNSPAYACSNNSHLVAVDGVPGYLCSCNPGYKGDGYSKGLGCVDIDECSDHDNFNDCVSTSTCENSPPGSYTCRCKAWFRRGDGHRNGSGCQVSQRLIVAVEISGAVALFGAMVGIFFCLAIWWRKRTKKKYFMEHGGFELQEILRSRTGGDTRIFKEEELKSATNSYADHMKLGAGGFGTVFKGVLEDKTVVAIKKANMRKGNEGDREQFLNEMAILVRINHRHIVRLLGCCLETAVPLLVYEFISNGTLEQNLEGKNGTVVMGWQQRLEVARQTAEALAYLHAAASPPILHRDVKSANVLLDDNFDAKVADFGFSRLVLDGVEELTAGLPGTIGYLDPECIQTLELTDKSDVYSLGVILSELITGLKAFDSRNRESSSASLVFLFLQHMEEGKLDQLIDARLAYNLSDHDTHSSIMAVAVLACHCLHLQGSRRPSMSHVVDTLRHIVQSLKSGQDEDEDESVPILSSKDYEVIEYAENNAIVSDDSHSQCFGIPSDSIHQVLINSSTFPR